MSNRKPLKEEYVPRTVIGNRLLAALNKDDAVVAIVFNEADLDLLTYALRLIPEDNARSNQLIEDIKQLKIAAFRKPGENHVNS